MAHKEIRHLKDLSQQQVHLGEILTKYLAECSAQYNTIGTYMLLAKESATILLNMTFSDIFDVFSTTSCAWSRMYVYVYTIHRGKLKWVSIQALAPTLPGTVIRNNYPSGIKSECQTG